MSTTFTRDHLRRLGYVPDGKGGLMRIPDEQPQATDDINVWTTPPPQKPKQVVTLILPHPPEPLRPNWRGHWARKAKAVSAYRKLACLVAKPYAPRVPWKNVAYKITWEARKSQAPDPDNIIASFKAGLDGLADAGLFVDDSSAWPERPLVMHNQPHGQLVVQLWDDTE